MDLCTCACWIPTSLRSITEPCPISRMPGITCARRNALRPLSTHCRSSMRRLIRVWKAFSPQSSNSFSINWKSLKRKPASFLRPIQLGKRPNSIWNSLERISSTKLIFWEWKMRSTLRTCLRITLKRASSRSKTSLGLENMEPLRSSWENLINFIIICSKMVQFCLRKRLCS